MRCLYCGKQLALFKRLTGRGEFCSDAHKHQYEEEYNRTALSRLMQAQAKSEEVKPALAKPPTAQPVAILTHEEPAWTSVQRTGQKRLQASTTPAPVPTKPPPKANFIVVKPDLLRPATLEPRPMQPEPPLVPDAASPPVFLRRETSIAPAVEQSRVEQSFIPPSAGLLKTWLPFPLPSSRVPKKPASAAQLITAAPITMALGRRFRCVAELPFADLATAQRLPPEPFNPPPLQPPVRNALKLVLRPFPPSPSTPAVAFHHLHPRLQLILPKNSPLPLRPPSRPRPVASPVANHDQPAPPSPEPERDIELPPFLRVKELEQGQKPAKVWGNVHKYLKDLVGCLLLAGLLVGALAPSDSPPWKDEPHAAISR